MPRSFILRFVGISPLCLAIGFLANASSAARLPMPQSAPASAATPNASLNLLENSDNTVQLGLQINGSFSYPFTFSVSPALTNGISISPAGIISGKPSANADQKITVTVTDSTGKPIATYNLTIHFLAAIPVVLSASSATSTSSTPSAPKSSPTDPAMTILLNASYVGGDTITGTVLKTSAAAPALTGSTPDPPASPQASSKDASSAPSQQSSNTTTAGTAVATFPVFIKRGGQTFAATTDSKGNFSYQFGIPLTNEDAVTVSASGAASPQPQVPVQTPPDLQGEDLRAIVGYQQTGASSADFQQNWFTDFFINRPIGGNDAKFHWWGNVRVASFPQAGNQSVAELAGGLAAQVGALKLNQLAQGAEFFSGVEYHVWSGSLKRGLSENTFQKFSLGIVAAFGATGFFSSPASNVAVFQVPAAGSPQSVTFQTKYPGVTTPYVAFITPDAERFPKQYLAGLRLTTRYIDPTGMPLTTAPAMLALTLGQNAVITGGKLQGLVGRVEAFYPLPFGNRGQGVAGAFSSIYLFGTVQMRLGGSTNAPALVLASAPSGLSASDPSVTLIPAPSVRDEYRLGFGVDLVSLISQLTTGSSKAATTAATAAKVSGTPSTTQ